LWREDNIIIDHKRIFSKYDGIGNRGIVVIFETEARYVSLHCPHSSCPQEKKIQMGCQRHPALSAMSTGGGVSRGKTAGIEAGY